MRNPIKKLIKNEGFVPIIRTLGCIGDSLSSGEHESFNEKGERGYHDYYEYSWGQFIARKCGLKCINFSRGGLKAIDFLSGELFPDMFNKENLCQAYTIALGVNDINALCQGIVYRGFGDLESAIKGEYDENLKTFIGCYVNLIKKIKENQPKARIFLVTTPKSSKERKEWRDYANLLAQTIRQIPKFFEFVYVIDLNKYSVDYDKKEFRQKYYVDSHMNAMGYKYTADVMITYIDYIIRNNVEDFRQIGFVLKNGEYNVHAKW